MSDGLGRFILIWISQLISLVGSALTAFLVSVWTFEQTGSATQFALIMLCAAVSATVVAPFAGSIADRFDRRRVLIISDCVAALATALLALLLATGRLQVWEVYPITAVTAAWGMFHIVTFGSMVPLLVPKRHLSRANGLTQIVQAAQIAAPLLAGILLVITGLAGVVMIDVATTGISLAAMIFIRLPKSVTQPAGAASERLPLRQELAVGWAEIRRRPGMVELLILLAAFDFCFGLVGSLVRPLVLSFASPTELGVQVFAGGSGLMLGSFVIGIWGGPRRRVTGVLVFLALGAVALAMHSAAPSVLLLCIVGPLFLFTLSIVDGCALTLIQSKVDQSALGRVMATVRMTGRAASALAYAIAGPLADGVFEPMMRPGGALADSFGRLIGVGPGRGIALIFALVGALLLIITAVAAARPGLRRVDELPDLLEPVEKKEGARGHQSVS